MQITCAIYDFATIVNNFFMVTPREAMIFLTVLVSTKNRTYGGMSRSKTLVLRKMFTIKSSYIIYCQPWSLHDF